MNKITLAILLSLCTLAVSSCKKSSGSTQSIAGTWTFTGISGTSTNYTDSTDGTTTKYSYGSDAITSTVVNVINGNSTTSASSISVTTETWVFNGDGTYTINEAYDNGGGTTITNTSTGTWYYLSGSKPNDAFEFTGQLSQVLYYTGISPTLYNIQSAGNTLVLTITNGETTSTGSMNTNNITLTFSKS